MQILPGFVYLKRSLFALILKIYAEYGILGFTILFSHHFEDTSSLPSGSIVVIGKSAVNLLFLGDNLLRYFICL